MLLWTQAPDPLPREGDDIVASTRAARAAGFTALHLPPHSERRADLLRPILRLAPRPVREPAVWVGRLPDPHDYRAVHAALRERGIDLLNDPEQHLRSVELDRAFPRLAGLTPRSVVVSDVDAAGDAALVVGLPAFVRGAVRSRKDLGWGRCVATTLPELRERIAEVLRSPFHARGRAIVRALVPLRRRRVSAGDVPIAREHRVVLHRGEPLGHGLRWPHPDEFAALSPAEETEVLALARRAAERLDVPFLALDVAQLESGEWTVLAPKDPQFTALCGVDPRPLWRRLAQRLSQWPEPA